MEEILEQTDNFIERFKLTSDLLTKQNDLMLAMLKLIEFNTRPKGGKHA